MTLSRRVLLALAFILIPIALQAQKQNNVWYFGYNAGIDFNGPTPVSVQGGMIDAYEGTCSIADRRTGRLLFYTDGVSVWDRNHALMPSGRGLHGHNSSTQAALIVPMPGDSAQYYIFTTDAIDDELRDGLQYSTVDMRLNGGLGDVAAKNVPVLAPVSERQTAIPSCDGRSWWVLAHGWNNNNIYAYRITALGVQPPVISSVGQIQGPALEDAIGYMKASPDGRRLAIAIDNMATVQLFDFDAATGIVSNPITLPSPAPKSIAYGVCFSPDNSKLYVAEYFNGIYQYDLNAGSQAGIMASRFEIMPRDPDVILGALQLGPDGRIYSAVHNRTALGIIEHPNALGSAASFIYGGFPLSYGSSSLGLPNLIDAYTPEMNGATAGPDIATCGGNGVQLHASGGSSYQWSPTVGLSCAACPDPVANPLVTTTYTVLISNGGACPFIDSVTVSVRPKATVDAGADQTICRGGSAQLTSTKGAAYRWTPAIGLSCTDCRSPLATPDSTTVYTVTLTDSAGCTATDSLRVTVVGPSPNALGEDTTICRGNSVLLHAADGTSWKWSPGTGLSCTDCQRPIATPLVTTTYRVIVTGINGCISTDSITITVAPPITADAGADTTICQGGAAFLHVSGGTSWRWSPADGLSCADCADPVATPTQTTTYRVIATGKGGCVAMDSVTVTVIPAPAADAGKDTTICAGGSATLSASDGISWRWSPAIGLSCAECQRPIASPLVTTVYRVEIAGSGGCPGYDSVIVTVAPMPIADAGKDTTICAGGSAMLEASDGAAWRWSPADGLNCIDCRRPNATPNGTTTYRVTVFNAAGCSAVDSVTVTVAPPTIADAGRDTAICADAGTVLHARGGIAYRWSPPYALSCADCADPVATPARSTTYTVTAIGAGGCSSTDSVAVTILPAPAIDAGADTAICLGAAVQLRASGGGSYHWSPADGLDCIDCAAPLATPTRTTTYVVIGTGANGCAGIDSVTIFVHPSSTLHARIPRDLHLLPGDSLLAPILIDDPAALTTFNAMTLRIGYRSTILRLRGFPTARTAAAGWLIERLADTNGLLTIRALRPPGTPATLSDTLLLINIAGFVGDTIYSDLPLMLDLGDGACTAVEAAPGLLRIDSICGLSQRLIQPLSGAYALKQNAPNPFSPATTITFSLGLDGPTTLAILNERGETVATLIAGQQMGPGTYSVVWDASGMPSGMYYCRLTSGDWMDTKVMMVVR